MGTPVLESDDSEPFKRGPPTEYPLRNPALRGVPQNPGPATPGRTAAALGPASKPKTKPRRGVFEGDAAAIELRSRLAKARDGTLPTPTPEIPARPSAARLLGFALVAAGVAGGAGYFAGGSKLSTKPALLAAVSGDTDAPPAPVARTAHLKAPGRDSERAAAPTAAPAGVRQLPPSSASPPPAPEDASEIAAKMKLGADLMAAGDIAAARTMFARVAEAGDAAGAFALAETYDPAVLSTMPVRGGGITANPALARRWYEKAREMGSAAAPERIARLLGR
jgi:hypothetical protein